MGAGDFNLELWAKKGAIKIATAAGISAVNATVNYFTDTLAELPTEYVLPVTMTMAVLQVIGNWLKHR